MFRGVSMKRHIAWIILIVTMPLVFSHLDAAEDHVVNGYLLDLGYAPEYPLAGEKVSLVVNLVNETTEESINATSMWLRISNEQDVVFAGIMALDQGGSSFTYVFPSGGKYTITAQFRDGEHIIAQTDYELEVQETANTTPNQTRSYIIALVIIVLIAILYTRYSQKKKHLP